MIAEVFGKSWCGYCDRAKQLLDEKGVKYTYLDVEADPAALQEMRDRSPPGTSTVPQVFVDGNHIGGYDALRAYLKGK